MDYLIRGKPRRCPETAWLIIGIPSVARRATFSQKSVRAPVLHAIAQGGVVALDGTGADPTETARVRPICLW